MDAGVDAAAGLARIADHDAFTPGRASAPDRSLDLSGGWPAIGRWWARVCAGVDQQAVIAKLREEARCTPRYAFMTAMSAGIAILGLLLSSPAVVIGAMLLSPLMGPILGAGFALAIGDSDWLRSCGRSLLIGIVLAVLFCAAIVLLSPLRNVTEEIAARTRPNLFDLGVALFSALAGAYAMIRGREGTIVGVAIATALMPPIAVIGFGLATANWTVLRGSSFLFFTNLMTIALTSALMAKLYGFRHNLSPQQTRIQVIGIAITFVALAIPLGLSLKTIAWEASASSIASTAVQQEFGPQARLSSLDIDYHSDPVGLTASVLTPQLKSDAEPRVAALLRRRLGRSFDVRIHQFRVGTRAGQAEAAELAAARTVGKDGSADQAASDLARQVALVAGVDPAQVMVDAPAHRLLVRAGVLPGASLETWRALEQRLAAAAPGWGIELIPPPLSLPEVTMVKGEPDAAGQLAIATAAWAAQRIAAPVAVTGRQEDVARVAELLRQAGAKVVEQPGRGRADVVTLSWLAPDRAAAAS